MRSSERHDPDGAYVRRWCPELRDVPLERLAEPWTMSDDEQRGRGLRDRPRLPGADRRPQRERERAIERYRAIVGG